VKPESPCVYLLQNEDRKVTEKPNIWSKMNSRRINIKFTKIPAGGEVYLFGSFHPDFWKNQPKTEKYIVKDVGTEHSF